jgi:hypothetical protein
MTTPSLISNFEVLFTPQLPPGFPAAVENIVETVVKGYFLTISNISDQAFVFQLGFHCNTNPSPASPTRTLASAVAFLDDQLTGATELFSASSDGTDFYANVTIQAKGTVLLGILPAFFSMATGQFVAPTIEARGWVDILLPALHSGFGYNAQSPDPVPVIVTAEQRLTFLPASGEPGSVVESQSAFALPLAGGGSEILVPAAPSYIMPFPIPVPPGPLPPHPLPPGQQQ